ncbi:hypothetical protein EUGRSUZ_H03625 [Eucalyptus grandis]|uniref:Uncharacterized protein n=2 Tax=Eucalyptus grandis TaxID=71139 RepID=A0A059B5F9_EUCGR|nr:hypothetical protein EUGRSUZ_H03625 [Eucalyptus grandis]
MRDRNRRNSVSPLCRLFWPPEKKLTLFALRRAVLENAATGLGTLGFIWPMVVILGGFANALDKTDFFPIVPYAGWVFVSRNISKILYWLQLLSATACVMLSLMKLLEHNFGEVAEGDTVERHQEAALRTFYAIALADALVVLTEKIYWQWKVVIYKLLERVNEECNLGALEQLCQSYIIQRLVEFLNWKDPQEEEIRLSAAEIVSKLAGEKQNSLCVAGIPGAIESILSLLLTNGSPSSAADKIGEKKIVFDHEDYGYWTSNNLGLLIRKKLAHDQGNCGKIGNTRGLLSKIIDFTRADKRILKDSTITTSQVLTVKRSLQVIKMLASTTGTIGKNLRREILEIKQPELQKLGIEILTSLAQDNNATERVGGTGGVLKELLKIFFQGVPENQRDVRIVAGEALAMLAFESKSNCHRILKLNVVEKLLKALEIPLLHVNAGRILRNLCTYSGPESFNQLKGVTAVAPTVLKAILSGEGKLQEVIVGLAVHAFKFMTAEESTAFFKRAGFSEAKLACALVEILRSHWNPHINVPD